MKNNFEMPNLEQVGKVEKPTEPSIPKIKFVAEIPTEQLETSKVRKGDPVIQPKEGDITVDQFAEHQVEERQFIQIESNEFEIEEYIKRISHLVVSKLEQISRNELNDCESFYAKDVAGTLQSDEIIRQPHSYGNYRRLRRMLLSVEDVARLLDHKDDVVPVLAELVKEQRKKISTILDRPENRQRIHRAIEETVSLNKELGISEPLKPAVQFVGKLEYAILSSDGTSLQSSSGCGGAFVPNINLIEVEVDAGNIEADINDGTIQTTVIHEFEHASSNVKITNAGSGRYGFVEADRMKVGFLSRNKKNVHRPVSFLSLNEGTTELFARISAERQKLDVAHSFGIAFYDGYVADVMALMQYLEGSRVNSPEMKNYEKALNLETLQKLASFYTSGTGVLALGREMTEKIGRQAPALYDLLSSSRQGYVVKFLRALQVQKAGAIPEIITISTKKLQSYSMKIDSLKEQFPFIQVSDK